MLIPGYLDRLQIVTRDANDEVAVAMYDRWAEPLENGIAQVLADNLGAHVASERIAVFPWRGGVPRVLDYQVVVVVLRFEGWPGRQATLDAPRPDALSGTAKPPDLARHRKGRRCRDMSSAALTDFLPDTAYVARAYCPGCEPDADPSRDILDVRWCESHSPARDGADDDVVSASAYLSGSAEAGGDDNRRWCDMLHGRR